MTADAGAAVTDALWLDVLQQVCGRAAHEVKGALNGVAVNLEVVRSRAERPDAPAAAVATFANAAVDQLGIVISLSDALLSLLRPPREPATPGPVFVRLAALLAPAVRVQGGRLNLHGEFDGLAVTPARPSAVGMSVGACLLAAIDASRDVRCRPEAAGQGSETVVRIECGAGMAPAVDPEILVAAAEAGIHIVAESSVISISFPR